MPLVFNAEAGAYINAIRSSLDILASAVGKREISSGREIYFPIAESADIFASGNYKGSKFVRQLSRTHRELFEACKPYKEGNDTLYALHNFDNIRKHKRLLTTYM